ncbi:MAG: hypothetical protein ACOYBW_00725 [Fluviibacter phosphoraccumulans]
MKSIKNNRWSVFASTIIAVCSSSVALAQDAPPRINEYQNERPVWNSTSGFSAVPKHLQKIGDAECKKMKFDRAVGYSKNAKNPDGSDYEKGGFLCESNTEKAS